VEQIEKRKRNRMPYNAEMRAAHFNIRRGEPYRGSKSTGEHRSEVHVKNGKKE
jgi:hypothetical protein